MAICKLCNGQGRFYFGDSTRPICPSCAGTGESPVIEPIGTGSGRRRASTNKGRDGELLLGLVGVACLVAGSLAFQYSSDVVLSYFQIVYVRQDNYGYALLYAASTLLASGIISRYWGPVPGFCIGLIPLAPTLYASFADDLGGFSQVVGVDSGSGLVLFSVGSALFLIFGVSMMGHDLAKRKLAISGVRSLVRSNGAIVTMALIVLSVAAFAAVQVAWEGFVAANTY